MADKVLTRDDIEVGDTVQIVAGAVCVTNGVVSKPGGYYVQGGSLWATISSITDNWQTGSLYGLPAKVTKVRLMNQGVAVWDVQPKDIAPNIIKKNPKKEEKKTPKTKKKTKDTTPKTNETPSVTHKPTARTMQRVDLDPSPFPYVPKRNTANWLSGRPSGTIFDPNKVNPSTLKYAKMSSSMYSDNAGGQTPVYQPVKATITGLPQSILEASNVTQPFYADYKTSWQETGRRNEMLNKIPSLIQNTYGFPFHAATYSKDDKDKKSPSPNPNPDLYDYQIIIDDPRLKKVSKLSLEDQLMNAREQFGLPVHGNNRIAKSMKMYMYNRFKVPDTNLAHNKSFTYVFFTRPDLNLLEPFTADSVSSYRLNMQLSNHTESALLWKQQPELFKLLTDHKRCGDSNNFNFLLSNQVTSFSLQDEKLNTNTYGKSWNGYTMNYGDQFDGRGAGTFTCDFAETSEYSIIKFMKLWITYIDNVSRGAWHPSYNLQYRQYTTDSPMNINDSHIFTKTLDYAAAAYVFKCAADGETVLYWSSYHGIFPTNTAANTLSWELDSAVGAAPKPSITFAYSWKRDMNPISLLEFNNNANIAGTKTKYDENGEKSKDGKGVDAPLKAINSYNPNLAGSYIPFVGCPFIEMDLGEPVLTRDGVGLYKSTTIKLKFKKDTSTERKSEVLYKNSYKKNPDSKLDTLVWEWIDQASGEGHWVNKDEI